MHWLLISAVALVASPAALASAPFAAPTETSGMVAAVDVAKSELAVKDAHGRRWTFRVSKSARITINNRPARLAELGPGDTVRVLHEADGKLPLATEVHAMQM